jgi:hypothetical protein
MVRTSIVRDVELVFCTKLNREPWSAPSCSGEGSALCLAVRCWSGPATVRKQRWVGRKEETKGQRVGLKETGVVGGERA